MSNNNTQHTNVHRAIVKLFGKDNVQLNIARNAAERIRYRMISMKRKRMVQKHHRRLLILQNQMTRCGLLILRMKQ